MVLIILVLFLCVTNQAAIPALMHNVLTISLNYVCESIIYVAI